MPGLKPGLNAGYVNSWIEQYTQSPVPCINPNMQQTVVQSTEVEETSIFSNCLVWAILGFMVGSIRFQKKGQHQ